MPGGIIILTYETKIAEMKLSEPSKNDFQFSKKNLPKLKIFAWEIGENLENPEISQIWLVLLQDYHSVPLNSVQACSGVFRSQKIRLGICVFFFA